MKKLLLFLIAITLTVLILKAQVNLTFQNLADMNLMRGAITSSTDYNFIYVANGYSSTSSFTTEIEKYDIASNSWSIFTNSLIAKRFSSSVIVGSNLYLFNGYSTGYVLNNKMEIVNLINGSITYSTDNPFPTHNSGAATWNNNIYVFGGSPDGTETGKTNKLLCFNTLTHVWSELASMPVEKQTKGEIVNGKLYVLGGFNGNPCNRIDMYDIANNSWTNLGIMSDSISGFSTAVVGSKIYLIGDYDHLTHLACYDVSTNTYSLLQESNMIGRRNSGAEVINGKLYIIGGNQTSSISSSISSLQVAELPTSINFISNNDYLNIYPNPVNDKLTIEISKTGIADIIDLQGKVLTSVCLKNQKTIIDLHDFLMEFTQ